MCARLTWRVQAARHPDKFCGEAAYFHTHLTSALTFLEHMTADHLTIDPDQYATLCEDNMQRLRSGLPAFTLDAPAPAVHTGDTLEMSSVTSSPPAQVPMQHTRASGVCVCVGVVF